MAEEIRKFITTEIQPLIEGDGGLIYFSHFTEDRVLFLKVEGACVHCSSLPLTIHFLIEEKLKDQFPEIKSVVVKTHSLEGNLPVAK